MVHRIEVHSRISDTRAHTRKKQLSDLGFQIDDIHLVDVYAIDASLKAEELEAISTMLINPVVEEAHINEYVSPEYFSFALEIGFLPGVTDNEGSTVREGIEDLLGKKLPSSAGIYTSKILYISGNLTRQDMDSIANLLGNPLIKRSHVKGLPEYRTDLGMGLYVPRVMLDQRSPATLVDILGASDAQLLEIGKRGIPNLDGSRRGPLALSLLYLKAIKAHYQTLSRNPTDLELESIAQTWSEHCKHTIFADPIDEIKEGLYKHYIQAATNRIREKKGALDICVSIFQDNSGCIVFDVDYLLTDKVETHNTPSALDPFGGAITGIVGVNRDAIGFGLGAKPIFNGYGYCFGDPDDKESLYKDSQRRIRMLTPRQILDGVVEGVRVGGNCSGIPTTQGFIYFDDRYKGKPLVFVRTGGLIPKQSAGRPSYQKKAMPGDYIVMLGGRVGKDGIHGATFSSEALSSGSPATAVQIGDPITQKKLSDALLKEARDLGLYNSITDDGAGGLSCSVAEMARESGGCIVSLDKVPLKYPGLADWEIWISESQERMTLAVPPNKWEEFRGLMQRRGVEATAIGEFTGSGRCIVRSGSDTLMDLDLDFLHNGLPKKHLESRRYHPWLDEPSFQKLDDLTSTLHSMLGRKNIASFEFISSQYDHEVQGGSVLKPLQGRGRVNADTTVIRPRLDSYKGVLLSQGIYPSYSEIDSYHMAASAIDTAIRNVIAAGGSLDHLALLDNFCWCSSTDPERLAQLKDAARACYDYAVEYGTPFISGKDSMWNDFIGYDKDGDEVRISIPPTLLVSSLGVMADSRRATSIDAKSEGDLVYVLGSTYDELGGSEYFIMRSESELGKRMVGSRVPEVDARKNKRLYQVFSAAAEVGIVASAQSVGRGGLGVALAKTSMAGRLGMDISLEFLSGSSTRDDYRLYSESQGRIVVTVDPAKQCEFERMMQGVTVSRIGVVRDDSSFIIMGSDGKCIVNTSIDDMLASYRATFGGY